MFTLCPCICIHLTYFSIWYTITAERSPWISGVTLGLEFEQKQNFKVFGHPWRRTKWVFFILRWYISYFFLFSVTENLTKATKGRVFCVFFLYLFGGTIHHDKGVIVAGRWSSRLHCTNSQEEEMMNAGPQISFSFCLVCNLSP